MKRFGAVLSVLALILFTQQDSHAGQYLEQVKLQLSTIKLKVIESGYEDIQYEDKYGMMSDGEVESYQIKLNKGQTYAIVGVCDEDCSDMDLILFDENDNEIDRDTKNDSVPIVEVSPRWTGQFVLKVSMASCEDDPCAFGFTVLSKED